jgi:hypothetical protein
MRSDDVREVRFIVDHQRWWVDRSPPYGYGPDGADLPTRFISSLGKHDDVHNFEVDVITTSHELAVERYRLARPALEQAVGAWRAAVAEATAVDALTAAPNGNGASPEE